MSELSTFGQRLRSARKAAGLTASDLCARCNLSESAVRNQENGTNGASLALIERYAYLLGVAPGWLAFGDGAGVVPEVSDAPEHNDCMSYQQWASVKSGLGA